MFEKITLLFEWVALVIDIFGLSILVLGFVRGAIGWLRAERGREPWEIRVTSIRRLRCVVGVHILFALELMIVSDIIDSFVAVALSVPGGESFFHSATFYALMQLGMIVLIRTVLDYFVSRELGEFQKSAR